jgi:hypothetical protein
MDLLGVLLLLASVALHTGLLVAIHRLLRFCTQHREDKVFFSQLQGIAASPTLPLTWIASLPFQLLTSHTTPPPPAIVRSFCRSGKPLFFFQV